MRPLFLLCLLAPLFVFAQSEETRWTAFARRVNIDTAWKGLPFKFEAKLNAHPAYASGGCNIWLRKHAYGGQVSGFRTTQNTPVQTGEWQTASLEDMFQTTDSVLFFGGVLLGKGTYGFDDLKLKVQRGGQWEEIPLEGMNMDDTLSLWPAMRYNKLVTYTIVDKHLHADASKLTQYGNGRAPSGYGNNQTAGRFVDANGIRLYYEEYGRGEPVVLLHGNSQSIAAWQAQIPALAKKYRVIAIDSRMQGKSTDDGKPLTYELFAEDTKSLLDAIGIQKTNIIGWSDGGITGLILASRYPAMVNRLAVMGANLEPDTLAVKPWVIDEFKKMISTLNPQQQDKRRLWSLCLEQPHIPVQQLKSISCPTLVMAGEDDMIQDAHTRLIAASIPKSELKIFDKGDHFAPIKIPERFNEAVLTFLAK
ncbi:alpha/beta fold hydrolase [Chitinophaga lutea]